MRTFKEKRPFLTIALDIIRHENNEYNSDVEIEVLESRTPVSAGAPGGGAAREETREDVDAIHLTK